MGKDWDPYMVARDRSGRRIDQNGRREGERIRTGNAVFNGRELRMMIGIGLALAIILFEGTRSGFGLGMLASDDPAEKATPVRPVAPAPTTPGQEGEALRPQAAQNAIGGGTSRSAATSLLRGVTVRPETVRPIDGDSFVLHGERIRLADIDTPDLRAPCPYEAALGARAAQRLAGLLRSGPFQLSESFGRDADNEGRKLRIASRGGQSLGDTLVADGLARPWSTVSSPWCATGFGEL